MVIKKQTVRVEDMSIGSVFDFDNFLEMLRFEKAMYQYSLRNNMQRPVFRSIQFMKGRYIIYRLVVEDFKTIKKRV